MKVIRFAFLPLASLLLMAAPPFSTAQQSQYPIMDKLAQKVVEKYRTSSCADLKEKKEQPADPKQAMMKQRVMGMLKSDPKMREQFLNKVAAPIANKMFECGMIP